MSDGGILVNRAPVLTLWATVVAERLGYDWEESLTLGKALAGLNAQSKGKALGIYHEREPAPGEEAATRERRENLWIEVVGRPVPAKRTPQGIRAVVGAEPIEPRQVEGYLKRAFGDSLPEARAAMEQLAGSYSPEQLKSVSYDLYERFRPKISSGKAGWGQKSTLDLNLIRSLKPA